MLNALTIVELADPMTMNAGRILGDLGADVIVVEPPQGSPARRMGPFIAGEPGLENSLAWHACNQNKRSVTLDPRDPDGRALLLDLVSRADAVIEAVPTGDSQSILADTPLPDQLVHCVVTPFHAAGPKRHYRATDPILAAAGGGVSGNGQSSSAPLHFPVAQAMMETGGDAAIGTLAALLARTGSGGQRVDVVSRVATTFSAFEKVVTAADHKPHRRQAMAGMMLKGLPPIPVTFDCLDGIVLVTIAPVPSFRDMMRRLGNWTIAQGKLSEALRDRDWVAEARAGGALQELVEAVRQACATLPWRAIIDASRSGGFMAAPIMSMADIAGFDQFVDRGLFAPTTIAGRPVDLPIRFAQFRHFEIAARRPAPRLGEHNREILGDLLGLDPLERQALFAKGAI